MRELDAFMTQAEALAYIERTLPPVWADLWSGRTTPPTFSLSAWATPHTYYLGPAELEAIAPGLTGLCPLVERNGEAIMGWLPDGRFVEFYYEDAREGDAAIRVLGRNYQEFVLSLLLELEDAGLRDEWIAFAAAVQFAHTAELVGCSTTRRLTRAPSPPCAIASARNEGNWRSSSRDSTRS